jgi:TM2 domain-containing membrane protein YozV
MYSVVGADGQVYGPIDAAGLRQWCLEGRIRPDTTIYETSSGSAMRAADMPDLRAILQGFGHHATPPHAMPIGLPTFTAPTKSKMVAALLAVVAGPLGVHRFYIGRWGSGLLFLLSTYLIYYQLDMTYAICVVISLIDAARILAGDVKDGSGHALV